MALVEAIARYEGFYKPSTIAQRSNNPGNIRSGAFAATHGAISNNGPYAVFPNAITGFQALLVLLHSFYSDMTLEAAINKYAPAGDSNDPVEYLKMVCIWTGSKPTDLVRDILARPCSS